jgi:hypothetical protein
MVDFPRPLEPSDTIDRAGELCPSVARLPHRELRLPTVPGECTVGWGSLRCTHCRGSGTGEPPPAVPRHVLERARGRECRVVRALRADAGRALRPIRPAVGHVSRPPVHAGQAACSRVSWAAASRPRAVCADRARFCPRSKFKLKIPFLVFYLVSTKFKLQKIVSKYPELQKL